MAVGVVRVGGGETVKVVEELDKENRDAMDFQAAAAVLVARAAR